MNNHLPVILAIEKKLRNHNVSHIHLWATDHGEGYLDITYHHVITYRDGSVNKHLTLYPYDAMKRGFMDEEHRAFYGLKSPDPDTVRILQDDMIYSDRRFIFYSEFRAVHPKMDQVLVVGMKVTEKDGSVVFRRESNLWGIETRRDPNPLSRAFSAYVDDFREDRPLNHLYYSMKENEEDSFDHINIDPAKIKRPKW